MSDRPTPETDREWDRLQMLPGGGYSSQVAGVKLAFGMARWASELERQRDEARDLARELRDALKELADNGHTEECDALNYANKHCDCGVDSARMLISKAKEVLP